MSDLPVCKLCGCDPHRNPDGKLGHKRGSRCKLVSAVYFNDEEWQTLMAAPGGEAVADDRAVLMYLMQQFDSEEWNCENCGHSEPTSICDSAHYLRNYLKGNPATAVDDGVLRDAVRYRFIKSEKSNLINDCEYIAIYSKIFGSPYSRRLLLDTDADAAIDAAMKEQGNAKSDD